MEKYIDSHAHYLSYKFDRDRNELLKKLFETDVSKIIECGTNTRFNEGTIALANAYENIYGVIGYFPLDTLELERDPSLLKVLEEHCQNPKILGIGEIGLDYYHKGDYAIQKKWFKIQLDLAARLGLPVCIHSRDAEEDTLQILREFGENKGVIHCYSYGIETMKELLSLGYYFGVGGTSTFTRNISLRDAIKMCPMDRILLETDAPYLSPLAVRGTRNDSSNIKYVIEELSWLKGISPERIVEITNENCKKVYNRLA